MSTINVKIQRFFFRRLFAFVILDQVPEYEIALRNFQEGTELVTDQSQAWNIR